MKSNLFTAICASVMVLIAVGVLFFAMTVYEQGYFAESWILTPTVIEKELKPLYTDSVDANSNEY